MTETDVVKAVSIYVGGKAGERVRLIGRYGDSLRVRFTLFDSRQGPEIFVFTIFSSHCPLNAGPWYTDPGLEGGNSLRLETRLNAQRANHFSPYTIMVWYLTRVKSHLPSDGIIRSSPYFPP